MVSTNCAGSTVSTDWETSTVSFSEPEERAAAPAKPARAAPAATADEWSGAGSATTSSFTTSTTSVTSTISGAEVFAVSRLTSSTGSDEATAVATLVSPLKSPRVHQFGRIFSSLADVSSKTDGTSGLSLVIGVASASSEALGSSGSLDAATASPSPRSILLTAPSSWDDILRFSTASAISSSF